LNYGKLKKRVYDFNLAILDLISQGAFNTQIVKDLFGNGIFATDGEEWRHQRKLASHEFSTKVLRDFSSDVFRVNAAKLLEKISSAAVNRTTINMQVLT
jgi:cytochrome P450